MPTKFLRSLLASAAAITVCAAAHASSPGSGGWTSTTDTAATDLPRLRTCCPDATLSSQPSALSLKRFELPDSIAPLRGYLAASSTLLNQKQIGFYSPSPVAPASRELLQTAPDLLTGLGMVYADGYIFLTKQVKDADGSHYEHFLYNAEVFTLEKHIADGNEAAVARCMTWDPSDGKVYGFFKEGSKYRFGTLDIYTATVAWIADKAVTTKYSAMAADGKGNVYVFNNTNETLYSVNKSTGKATRVGDVGMYSEYLTCATIDPRSGRFYYIQIDDDASSLYLIDKTAGDDPVKIYDFPGNDEYICLWPYLPLAEQDAPARVSDLGYSFSGGSLTGTLTFTMPSRTYAGTDGTGDLSYKVLVNGADGPSASAAWGAKVSVPVTVAAAGQSSFSVLCVNPAGNGPKNTVGGYIGPDSPVAPENVSLAASGTTMNLRWSAVKKGAHNAYIDPAAVTYTVIRLNDNKVVASSTADTVFAETLPMPATMTSYQYSVTAHHAGFDSPAASSNFVSIGKAAIPYTENFRDESRWSSLTVVDANKDGYTWKYHNLHDPLYHPNARFDHNKKKADDDWLYTPALTLEPGKIYKVSLLAGVQTNSHDSIEIKVGKAAEPSRSNITVLEPYNIVSKKYGDISSPYGFFHVPEAGEYFIGIHAISAARPKGPEYDFMHVDSIDVRIGPDPGTPARIRDLKLSHTTDGSRVATATFTTPALDMLDRALASIGTVTLMRGDKVVKVWTAPAPGARLSYTDTTAADGLYTYTVYAANDLGQGDPVSANTFVGTDKPRDVSSVIITEPAEGQVKLSWTAPTHGQSGYLLGSSLVSYDIYRNGSLWKQNFAGTELTDKPAAEGQQLFVQYEVQARTAKGFSPKKVSAEVIPVGKPQALPFAESVAGGKIENDWYPNPAVWQLATDMNRPGSEDLDNGFFRLVHSAAGGISRLESPKLQVPADGKAVFSFYYYHIPESSGQAQAQVRVANGQWQGLLALRHRGNGVEKWQKYSIDLSQFAGKEIQVGLLTQVSNIAEMHFDNIRVAAPVDNNLRVRLSAPDYMVAGRTYTVNVSIENLGTRDANGFELVLSRDSVELHRLQGLSVKADSTLYLQMQQTPDVFFPAQVQFSARAIYAPDADPTDNLCVADTTYVRHTGVPVPTGLEGSRSGREIRIHWNAPSTPAIVRLNDDIEDYEPFSTGLPGSQVENDNVRGWTMLDVKPGTKGTEPIIDGTRGPLEYPNVGRDKAFFVFANSLSGAPHADRTGHNNSDQYFMSTADIDGHTDDWMISPRLSGNAQQISFWARSLNIRYPERMQVLYSSESTDTATMRQLAMVDTVPKEWTKYEYRLPAGALHFAIRNCSDDDLALCIDDIAYEGANPYSAATFQGYNVYRDGRRVNDAPVMTTSYTDNTDLDVHTYHVTSIYSGQESVASNAWSCTSTAGLLATDAPTATSVRGYIDLLNCQSVAVTVADASGMILYSGTPATATLRLAAPAGVYALRLGSSSLTLLVP